MTVAKTGRRMKNSKIPISESRARIGIDDLDTSVVAELLVARGDDYGVMAETVDDLYLARPSLAELDLRQDGAAIDNAINKPFLATREHRGLRYEHRVFAARDDDLDASEQAGKKQAIRVRDPGAQPHGATVRIDGGIRSRRSCLRRSCREPRRP